MEKTDTIILSPEELAAYMAESTISVTSTYEHSPVVLMVDDTIIGTLGNFSASIGKAKSKKTFNVSAIVASALNNSTVLHYRSTFPENKRKILYIDTEQGRYHCQQVLKRILRLADLPEYKNPDNLIMLALRKFSPKLRLAIVEQAIGIIPDLGLVIIDGIRDFLYDINTVRLIIYQPRLENVDEWEISVAELLEWAEHTLKPTAQLAYNGEGEFCAGSHCRFCKAKAVCRKRAEQNLLLAQYEFAPPDNLEEHEIPIILSKASELVTWANDVKEYALAQALSGVHYDGYKLVEGRSVRKYIDKDAAAKAVTDAGYDPYGAPEIMGITAMEKLLGKKKFAEILSGYVEKPKGAPTLVPETDKRPVYSDANEDFKEEQ